MNSQIWLEKQHYDKEVSDGLLVTEQEWKSVINKATNENGEVPPNFRCIVCLNLVCDPFMYDKNGNKLYCSMCTNEFTLNK